ncbi:hypothetical protein [Streptomyces tremellae]|uniref:Uncharacterized protein n=1 Tax=Streptomyces tremellae TaxID=1124239 RepID=A0ABP7EXQ2_9ACTN
MLADATDAVLRLLAAFLNVNRGEGAAEVPWPEPLPRPGDEPAEQPDPEARAAERRAAAAHIFERTLPPDRR